MMGRKKKEGNVGKKKKKKGKGGKKKKKKGIASRLSLTLSL